ncbi:MAG TPA: DUF1648 domain-containing protein [Thermoanaerobaculia bacterium]|nr:DUF1648 domain-containing protein [Thermoanaerobaculia bacterium]
MTESAIAQAVFFSSVFVLFGVFAWMPITRGPRAFFGVRVETSYFDGEGKLILLRYRLVLAAVVFLVVAIAAALRPLVGEPAVLAGGELVLGIAAFLVYMRFAAVVRPHASAGGATRFASSMRARDTRNRVWLDVAVATFALLAFVAPVLSYDEMPLRVPIHWGVTGQADGWVDRNVSVVLFIPVLGAYLQFFLYVLRRDFAGAKMTLPADSTEEYRVAKEKFLQTNVDTLDWTRLTIATSFCGIALLQVSTAVERLRTVEPIARASVFLGLVAMLGGITFFIVRMIRINARLQQRTGNDYAQRSADESHWLHGGLTYSNPDDPALVVEKLVGVGYTLNMAHPGIRNRLLLMVGIPGFVIWGLLAMSP